MCWTSIFHFDIGKGKAGTLRGCPLGERADGIVTAAQLRASRALLGIDQRKLAEMAGLSLPTIQRMEASEGVIRGNVDSLVKLIEALDAAGLELIGEGAVSQGNGRGVRLKA
jgi:transcriptional regulator with XRE-family HTH domain